MTIEKKNSEVSEEISTAQKESFGDRFLRHFGERHKPVSKDYINLVATSMLEWGDQEDALSFNEFLGQLPHTRTQIYTWAADHPVLWEAIEITKTKLAVKRERRAAQDPQYNLVYAKNLGVYDGEHMGMIERLESIKAKFRTPEENKQTIVVIERVAEDSRVPRRKIKDADANTTKD